MEDASAESVDLVDHDAAKLVLGGIGHQTIQSGTACSAATEAGVHIFPGILPIAPGNVLPQFPQLHFAVLVGRAHPGVNGASHVSLSYMVVVRKSSRGSHFERETCKLLEHHGKS